MTVLTSGAPTAPAGLLRRNRPAVLIGVAMLVLIVLVTLLSVGRGSRGGGLDPENAEPGGARAVARVLADQGVPVRIVRDRAAFAAAPLDSRTTVVVSNPGALGTSTWNDLDDRVRETDAVLVVAGLSTAVVDGLGIRSGIDFRGGDHSEAADCEPAEDLLDGLRLQVQEAPVLAGDGCFGDDQGRYLRIDRQQHRWVLTDGSPLSNDHVDEADNAAVVLRLLGQRDRVLWYVADAGDLGADDAVSFTRLLPRWLVPSTWLVGVALVVLVLWRGRRLGPLVTERIPVTVRALESTTALGRLYERARDREHAAGILVEASAGRLVALVGLGGIPERHVLVTAVAGHTGRSTTEVAALLPLPDQIRNHVRSDTDLVTLARNLHQLEEEVRNR